MKQFLSEKNEVHLELALGAIAAMPTLQKASEHLENVHGISVSEEKLAVMREKYHGEYEKLREQLAPAIEASLTNDSLGIARRATEVEALAISRTEEMLAEGRARDPSRIARDLADVKAKNIDKRLALQGRPTQIVETRDAVEIIRQLEAMGVAKTDDPTDTQAAQ